MKRAKRFLVFCLSCVLALSTATLVPITANAEGTLPDVDASGALADAGRSSRIEVTDAEQTYTFTSTTNADASNNWDTPVFYVFSGDTELFAGRSDAYGWMPGGNTDNMPEGYNYQKAFDAPFADWPSWVSANQNGVTCKVTMRRVDNYAIVGFYNNGVTSIATIPVSGTASVVLSGEHCKLTNITQSNDHLDLTSAIDQISGGGGNDNDVPAGTFDLVDNSSGYRKSESPHMEVTQEAKTYSFTATSNADAVNNWQTPGFYVYSESGAELFAGRSDVYGWALADNPGKNTLNLPEGYKYQTDNVPADAAAWGHGWRPIKPALHVRLRCRR